MNRTITWIFFTVMFLGLAHLTVGRAVDDFGVAKPKKVKIPPPSNQKTYYAATVPVGNTTLTCAIETAENLHDFIDVAESEENVNLFEFHLFLNNYTYNPLHNTSGLFFKPWQWYTTRSRHGRTLLMLSFHYDVLSMNILTIGVKQIDVDIHDKPFGCFAQLNSSQRVDFVRMLLLSRNIGVSSSFGQSVRWVLASNREEFACNQEISNHSGKGEFVYNCCFKDQDGKVICSTKGDDFWINILYFSITLVKILMFLFCPKFLPNNLYSVAYVASEYVVTLKRELKMKIFVTEQTDANVRFKKRLTLEDISSWWKFREKLETLPYDEIVPIKMTDLRIKVQGKRIIPENDPPTGLIRTIYDNLIRCKVKNLDPFRDCCETSIYSDMEPKFRHKVTWHMFVQVLVKFLLLLLVPIPYYVRLFIYFKFEAEEIEERDAAIRANGLTEKFNLYRTNIIQYFSPIHGVFIATYIFYFLSGLVLGFADQAFREKLKSVARAAIGDMNAVAKTGVLGIIIRVILYPFKHFGLLGFLVAPFYLPLVSPMCAVVFVLYCIPTVYLTFRLPYHTRKLHDHSAHMADGERKRKLVRMHKLSQKISRMDKRAHRGGPAAQEESCFPDEWGWGGFATLKNWALQLFSSIFCLCILYSLALVFAESIGLFVEVMAFTMMGIIVNAGAVLKYVSMVLLVFVYMNDCYSNVYENYLTFNKTIMDDIIDRTTADIRKIASMPSSQQANTAFQVKCVDEDKSSDPSLNFDKKETRWRLGQLLLFLDCYDTPRIPLRLFQRLCQVQVSGAPGPVYLNLLAATGKFMIIVIFLAFVMIVVMAFGNVYQMSSTNTTLATLAGGFVPMLLKNVLNSKGAKLSLKTVSFKGQIDEIIDEYKQFWPVLDLLVERDLPEDEEKKDEDGEGSGEGGEKEQGNNTDSTDNNNKKDDKDGENKEGKGNGEAMKEKKVNFTDDKDGKDDKSSDSKNDKDAKGGDSKDKKGAEGGKDSNGDKDKSASDHQRGNGDIISGVGVLHATSLEEEGMVDLFIDLSVADTAGWSIYASSENMQNSDDEDTIMPPYFDRNKVEPPPSNVDGMLSVRYQPRQSIVPT
ncbi:hypothetical protein EGW08_020110 [Elysia chlorotica]|uniref:PLAT domain-containing protein n=1 Tax=Elysia chlorotica TaxID=188477 RepID=A0A3S1AU39_ELYCH|nr:hypothetical protein EGW08_020110 [Elysia chlorotica]